MAILMPYCLDLRVQAYIPGGPSFSQICLNLLSSSHSGRLHDALQKAFKHEKALRKAVEKESSKWAVLNPKEAAASAPSGQGQAQEGTGVPQNNFRWRMGMGYSFPGFQYPYIPYPPFSGHLLAGMPTVGPTFFIPLGIKVSKIFHHNHTIKGRGKGPATFAMWKAISCGNAQLWKTWSSRWSKTTNNFCISLRLLLMTGLLFIEG